MTRHRWRIAACLSAFVLVAPAVIWNTHPTLAVGQGSLTWTGTSWKDPNCGTSDAIFDVRFFRHTQYEGTLWRLCSNYNDFCYSPYGADSSDALACGLGISANDTMNDKASSLKVIDIKGGADCRVRIHEHRNYGGAAMTYWDPQTTPSLVPWPNDMLSSIRRVCG